MQQVVLPPPAERDWTNGLFNIFVDLNTCMLAWCCPCVLYGQTVQNLDPDYGCIKAGCHYACCCPCIVIGNRRHIRTRYHIKGNGFEDCFAHCCCHCCALIQEGNEVQKYGAVSPQTVVIVQGGQYQQMQMQA
ncbi:hypothetical protein HDU99_010491 [Rhizoclosmatium hyalinum]|nr:hypothetical protein HDU99_010491 [Rhizoclosmatium hyalinum]